MKNKYFISSEEEMWDNISYKLFGDEFLMSTLLEAQYSGKPSEDETLEIIDYLILPSRSKVLVNSTSTIKENEVSRFKAPWED